VWANLHYWAGLVAQSRRTARVGDKLRLFLARPGWRPEDLGGFQPAPEVDRATAPRFHVPVSARRRAYAFLQFAATLSFGAFVLFRQEQWTVAERAGSAAAVVVSLVTVGALLEGRFVRSR
jgi:hypothetical protein